LSRLPDEELVRRAQAEGAHGPCAAALFARYYAQILRRVARRARSVRLARTELPDAQQEALWALPQAIAAYVVAPVGIPGRCTFRTFLDRIVRARVYDFVRKLRRAEHHLDRSTSVAEALGQGLGPEEVAEGKELQRKVAQVLRQVDPLDRRLWEEPLAGTPLKAVADELGIPYHQAKRRRQAVRAYLAEQLRSWVA
jgi:RNA polymerase sigma factor (sigma-70 family)